MCYAVSSVSEIHISSARPTAAHSFYSAILSRTDFRFRKNISPNIIANKISVVDSRNFRATELSGFKTEKYLSRLFIPHERSFSLIF